MTPEEKIKKFEIENNISISDADYDELMNNQDEIDERLDVIKNERDYKKRAHLQ